MSSDAPPNLPLTNCERDFRGRLQWQLVSPLHDTHSPLQMMALGRKALKVALINLNAEEHVD